MNEHTSICTSVGSAIFGVLVIAALVAIFVFPKFFWFCIGIAVLFSIIQVLTYQKACPISIAKK